MEASRFGRTNTTPVRSSFRREHTTPLKNLLKQPTSKNAAQVSQIVNVSALFPAFGPRQFGDRFFPRFCSQLDRFIPSRSGMDFEIASYNLLKENDGPGFGQADLVSPSKVKPSKRRRKHDVPSCTNSLPLVRSLINLCLCDLQAEYKRRLAEGLMSSEGSRILAFKNKVESRATVNKALKVVEP
jgi:hypothetical protein